MALRQNLVNFLVPRRFVNVSFRQIGYFCELIVTKLWKGVEAKLDDSCEIF